MSLIADRYKIICTKIEAAARKAERDPAEVRLLVVSKTWGPEIIQEVVDCGHVLFGENKVQEAESKIPQLSNQLEWHFIGHLQKNKVRKVLPLCEMVESLDSVELGERMDRIAVELGRRTKALAQVNIAGEASKHGFPPEVLRKEFGRLLALENIDLCGLMAIPPAVDDPEDARRHFREIRELKEELEQAHGTPLPELSIGMSHDFEIAIEEGSTLVRVGSAIFGKRSG